MSGDTIFMASSSRSNFCKEGLGCKDLVVNTAPPHWIRHSYTGFKQLPLSLGQQHSRRCYSIRLCAELVVNTKQKFPPSLQQTHSTTVDYDTAKTSVSHSHNFKVILNDWQWVRLFILWSQILDALSMLLLYWLQLFSEIFSYKMVSKIYNWTFIDIPIPFAHICKTTTLNNNDKHNWHKQV